MIHQSVWHSLYLLTFPSIFIGYMSKDLFIGLGSAFWNNAIFVSPVNYNQVDSEFILQFYKLLPLCVSLLGASSALFFYTFASKNCIRSKHLF